MSGSTVFRVKRRLESDPAEALLVSIKKRKVEDAAVENAVLSFTGTVHGKDDLLLSKAVHEFKSKADLTENFKSHKVDISGKQREERRSKSRDNRFRILELTRSNFDSSDTQELETDRSELTIIDCDAVHEAAESSPDRDYVYDLYSTDLILESDFSDMFMSNLSVQPLYHEMEYRGSEDVDEVDPYEEDSNDEGNWRNDYPDSDHSINEDDMRLAASMRGMGIDEGHDLSPDSEDEEYQAMCGLTSRGGYDEYKRRVLGEFIEVENNESLDDDDDDYSND